MTWELTVAMLAITGGAAVFVAWPLLMGRTRAEEFFGAEPTEPVLQRLLFQRDTTYAAMKELEFDRAMGSLSEQDFEQLYERYKRKAVAILKRIDDARTGRLSRAALEEIEGFEEPLPQPERRRTRPGGLDLDVEQEIEAYRRKSKGPAEGSRVAPRPGAAILCPSCGRPAKDPEAAFCSRCGAPLRQRGGTRPSTAPRGKKSNGLKED